MIGWKRRRVEIGVAFLGIIALADAAWALIAVRLNSAPEGCLFGDGKSYCRLAVGQIAAAPFNRRILAPWLVRLMHFGSLASRLGIIDLASPASAALATVTHS